MSFPTSLVIYYEGKVDVIFDAYEEIKMKAGDKLIIKMLNANGEIDQIKEAVYAVPRAELGKARSRLNEYIDTHLCAGAPHAVDHPGGFRIGLSLLDTRIDEGKLK